MREPRLKSSSLYHVQSQSIHKTFSFNVNMNVKSLSRVRLFATQWTVAYQDPLSMGFSKQEYWSELPFPSPGGLPDPGIGPRDRTQVSCIGGRHFNL